MASPDYKKITQGLNYIAEKDGGEINYMKALKLLYLADRLHLRKYGRLITDDRLVGMKNGTLGSQARDIVIKNDRLPYVVYKYAEDELGKGKDDYSIKTKTQKKGILSKTDTKCIDEVFSAFGNLDEFALAEITHKLPEWKRHEYEIQTGEKSVVNLDLQDLFRSVDDDQLNSVYSQVADEVNLSQELFSESLEHKEFIDG